MKIVFDDLNIELIRSDRKTISLELRESGFIVRAPQRMSQQAIYSFLEKKRNWIHKHYDAMCKCKEAQGHQEPFTLEEIHELADVALKVIPEKVKHYAALIGVDYGRVTIRNQRTRWGSCSAKGNLNFNCLLMLCPEDVCDYVVVHELCHRKELNHSPKFWVEVERIIPDYKEKRNWLKKHGAEIIGRLETG